MIVKKNKIVTIDYSLRDSTGTLLDETNQEEGPLPYLHGHEVLLESLETVLEGKQVNEKVSVTLSPEEGYGIRDEELVDTVARAEFPEADDIMIGEELISETEEGPVMFTVLGKTDLHLKLDSNHPYAGKILIFDVHIKGIREATKSEIEHGHPAELEDHH